MGIQVLFIFCVLLPAVCLITLSCVPAFKLTFINFLVFVVGALGGMFLLGDALMFVVARSGTRLTPSQENNVNLLSFVIAMFVGGSALVWLRLRFMQTDPKR
jgi:hypothetical protein